MSTKPALRPDDLLDLPPLPDGQHYELSEGELIVVGSAGYRHEVVKSEILALLIIFARQAGIGRVFSESMFRISEETCRQPDVAFVRQERYREVPVTDKTIPYAPDLAVEVLSASESVSEAEAKVQQYLAGGVREVWQVHCDLRIVLIRKQGSIRELHSKDVLESDLLPGFRANVSDLFAPELE